MAVYSNNKLILIPAFVLLLLFVGAMGKNVKDILSDKLFVQISDLSHLLSVLKPLNSKETLCMSFELD